MRSPTKNGKNIKCFKLMQGIILNVSFKAQNFTIFVKNSRGGREVNMINTVSKINKGLLEITCIN